MFISTLKISFIISRTKRIWGGHGSGGRDVIYWPQQSAYQSVLGQDVKPKVAPEAIANGVQVYMWMVTAPEEQVAPEMVVFATSVRMCNVTLLTLAPVIFLVFQLGGGEDDHGTVPSHLGAGRGPPGVM